MPSTQRVETLERSGHWSFNLETLVLNKSSEAARICGLSASEPLSPAGFLRLVDPCDRARLINCFLEGSPGKFFDEAVRLTCPQGVRKFVQLRALQEFDEAANTNLIHGCIQELTPCASGDVSNAPMGTLAHEIRSRMTSLSGFSAQLRQTEKALTPAGQQYVNKLCRVSAELEQILRALEQIVEGAEPARQLVDVARLTREIVEDFRNSQPDRADIRMHVSEDMHVNADPGELRMLMENVLLNAFKFTAHTRDPMIWVSSEMQATRTVIHVRDNGIGFTNEEAVQIFELFARLGRAHEYDGSGIGLALAKRIVMRHRGHIWATGMPDSGATISFCL